LKRCVNIATEPTAAAPAWLRLRPSAEIEKLRGGRPAIPTRSATATVSATSGPLSVKTRKGDFGSRMGLGFS
jgi:hypothetical protein